MRSLPSWNPSSVSTVPLSPRDPRRATIRSQQADQAPAAPDRRGDRRLRDDRGGRPRDGLPVRRQGQLRPARRPAGAAKARSRRRSTLVAVNLDQKQPGFPADVLPRYLTERGVDFRIAEQDTYSVVKRLIPEGATMCSLCSRLRRGVLYRVAGELGATKIALGHHRDDLMATFFLNLFFGGKLKTMPPKLVSDDGKHVVIRPLAYVRERDLAAYAEYKQFPLIPCTLCGSQENLQRKQVALMLQRVGAQASGPPRLDLQRARQGRADAPPRPHAARLRGRPRDGVAQASGDIAFDVDSTLDSVPAADDCPAPRLVRLLRLAALLASALALTCVAQTTLEGKALVEALRQGGYVLYLRHASTDFGQNDEAMTDYANCAQQRNLTDAGRAEARAIGAAIKELRIPVGPVLASPYCRTRESAAAHLRSADRLASRPRRARDRRRANATADCASSCRRRSPKAATSRSPATATRFARSPARPTCRKARSPSSNRSAAASFASSRASRRATGNRSAHLSARCSCPARTGSCATARP